MDITGGTGLRGTVAVAKSLSASFFALIVAAPLQANAQSALNEITVTAQKRVESAQDTPISILVVSGDELRSDAISKLEDLTISMPNVTVTETALGDVLFLRGIGSGQNNGFEQSVGTFIDGIYYGRGLQTRNAFLDVERVEVLRGPQSTFFGNNTVAGALSIASKLPSLDEIEGYAQGAWETGIGKGSVEAAVGGPITDKFAIRVAGIYSDQSGWQTNNTIGRREPREEKLAGRLTALWEPIDDFNVVLRVQAETSDTFGRAAQATGCPPPDGQAPAGYCFAFGVIGNGQTPDFTFDDSRNGGDGIASIPLADDFNKLDTFNTNLTLNWMIGDHQLTSVTGYNEYDDLRAQAGILLAGSFPAPVIPFANVEFVQEEFQQISQEIRLASPVGKALEYIIGFYYQHGELTVVNDFSAATFATRLSDHRQEEDTMSGFGALTWNVSETFRISGGLRYTNVEKKVVREQILASNQGNLDLDMAIPMTPANPLFGAFVFGFGWQSGLIQATREDDALLPSVNVQYDFTDNIMGYASYAEGFKAGGFDEQNGQMNVNTLAFNPEDATSFEGGLKMNFLDGSMRLNLAGFYTEFKNLQVQTFDGIINFFVTNAGTATSSGAEAELAWQLTDSLRFDLQGAYLRAKNKDRKNAQCTTSQVATLLGAPIAVPAPGCAIVGGVLVQDLSGQPLTYSPEFSGNFKVTYEHAFDNGFELVSTFGGFFEDDFFRSDDNDPYLVQDAYVKFNASLRLISDGGNWELAVIGKNLFDVRTSHSGDDLPLSAGSYFEFLDKPRIVAVQVRAVF